MFAYAIYIYRNHVGRLNSITSIEEVEENPERARRKQRRFGRGLAVMFGIIGTILLLGGVSPN